jgi:hypothetical protein
MALKTDRYEESTDISYFYTNGTATRGGVVCLDVLSASYKAAAGATDVPVGVLLNDVVNKDLTRTHLNWYKDEVQQGGKVTVMTRGWVVTNNIQTGDTPTPGALAYASDTEAGAFSVTAADADGSGNLAVGRFMSRVDADGYAKVYVNLPNHGPLA